MRDFISPRTKPSKPVAGAQNSGYRPLPCDALKQALLGWITPEEAEKIPGPKCAIASGTRESTAGRKQLQLPLPFVNEPRRLELHTWRNKPI